METMKELYEKVSKDAALQEKFTVIMKDAEKASEETITAELTAFAKEAGYDVTAEEIQAFFKGLAEGNIGELSEAELDQVAGGKGQTQKTAVLSAEGMTDGVCNNIANVINVMRAACPGVI